MEDSETKSEHNESFDLPQSYNDNKIVLMARDPRTIYAYWEITEDVENVAREKIREAGLTSSKSILRLYNLTESASKADPKIAFDIELKNRADNWYICTRAAGGEWMVDIGILCTSGEFFPLAQSNTVKAPPGDTADVPSEECKSSYTITEQK